MDAHFTERTDGQVDVSLGAAWPLFNDALADSISSLPPRGAPGAGPSTYWIDVAARGVERAVAAGSDRPFTCGNVTLLRVVGDCVEARFDFAGDDEPSELMDVDDFRELLRQWRLRVIQGAARAVHPLPETYRRNGAGPAEEPR
ncbi:hypothetical protein [Cellulomonas xylanilytica]|uniref:Uncharacterized protein n=1 Tax=Cellulomonas xylanilytica TaxID=233583 RepID=A0A510VD98_9CELL|nr:hypothetical protein [Cellulomonas xylanilytica]GEK23190.1 hypothetical protein CXY01_37100 [Cellulomonas xylanilytica]